MSNYITEDMLECAWKIFNAQICGQTAEGDFKRAVKLMAPDSAGLFKFFGEIEVERRRQDERWGGLEYDNKHSEAFWRDIFLDQIADLTSSGNLPAEDYRHRLAQIAAVAAAAAQAYDRRAIASGNCDKGES